MDIKDAISLIRIEKVTKHETKVWADLGCGTGTFTIALANLLNNNSVVYAVDKNKIALKNIPEKIRNIKIEKLHVNFIRDEIPKNLDGILMANSLHFVKNKKEFINRIKQNLNDNGLFIMVEYDTEKSNPWVPYPISFNSLKILFNNLGFSNCIKINEYPSKFRRANLFSAFISW